VSDKVSAADLAVFQYVKQVLVFSDGSISIADEFDRLSEWYNWIE